MINSDFELKLIQNNINILKRTINGHKHTFEMTGKDILDNINNLVLNEDNYDFKMNCLRHNVLDILVKLYNKYEKICDAYIKCKQKQLILKSTNKVLQKELNNSQISIQSDFNNESDNESESSEVI